MMFVVVFMHVCVIIITETLSNYCCSRFRNTGVFADIMYFVLYVVNSAESNTTQKPRCYIG